MVSGVVNGKWGRVSMRVDIHRKKRCGGTVGVGHGGVMAEVVLCTVICIDGLRA